MSSPVMLYKMNKQGRATRPYELEVGDRLFANELLAESPAGGATNAILTVTKVEGNNAEADYGGYCWFLNRVDSVRRGSFWAANREARTRRTQEKEMAVGGSDVCITCAAHCAEIEHLLAEIEGQRQRQQLERSGLLLGAFEAERDHAQAEVKRLQEVLFNLAYPPWTNDAPGLRAYVLDLITSGRVVVGGEQHAALRAHLKGSSGGQEG